MHSPRLVVSLKGVHFSEPGHMLSITESLPQSRYSTRPSPQEVPDLLHRVGSLWVLLLGFIAVPSPFHHHHRGGIAGSSYTVRFACLGLHDILVLSYETLERSRERMIELWEYVGSTGASLYLRGSGGEQ